MHEKMPTHCEAEILNAAVIVIFLSFPGTNSPTKKFKKEFFSKRQKRMVIPKNSQACGCLIGHSVIEWEKSKRKSKIRLQAINRELKSVSSKEKLLRLRRERKEVLSLLSSASRGKSQMKRHFDHYVKKSGYISPSRKSFS